MKHKFLIGIAMLSFFFLPVSLIAQQVKLLKDINPLRSNHYPNFDYLYQLTSSTDHLFFVGTGCHETPEVYAVDAAGNIHLPANIKLDNDFDKYRCKPSEIQFAEKPVILWQEENKVYFTIYQEETGIELWSTDGTETHLVKDFNPGTGNGPDGNVIKFKDKYWLSVFDETGNRALWSTDGTTQGTVKRDDISGQSDIHYLDLISSDDYLYFLKWSNNYAFEVWQSDGTPAGTKMLQSWSQPEIRVLNIQVIEQTLHITLKNNQLKQIDLYNFSGSGVAPTLLATYPDVSNNFIRFAYDFVRWNDRYYFSVINSNGALEIHETDGTMANTRLYRNLSAVNGGTWSELIALNDQLFVLASVNGKYQLIELDGSPAGFNIITALSDEITGYQPWPNAISNGKLYFSTPNQIWETDGTATGTRVIMEPINFISQIIPHKNHIYFTGITTDHANTIWRYDGITGLKPQPLPSGNTTWGATSEPGPFVVLQNEAYWWAYNDDGLQIAKTNGMPTSTTLENISGDQFRFMYSPTGLHHSEMLFFMGYEDVGNVKLMLYDKNTSTANAIQTFYKSTFDEPALLNDAKAELAYFSISYDKLYRSDGTKTGTFEIAQDVTKVFQIFDYQDNTWLVAKKTSGPALIRTDGTAAGTSTIAELAISGNIQHPVAGVLDDKIYYFSADEFYQLKLWETSGGNANLIAQFEGTLDTAAFGPSSILFTINGQLWISDGTASGTRQIPLPPDAQPLELTAFKSGFLLSISNKDTGRELWMTDETPEGLHLVKDMEPGQFGSAPQMTKGLVVDSLIYFPAFTQTTGMELWQSDGTEAGTKLTADICPGPCSGQPNHFKQLSSQYLLLHAYTPEHGFEARVLDLQYTSGPLAENCTINATVYPNPASQGITTITFPDHIGATDRFVVLDAAGRRTSEGSISPWAASINLNLQGVHNGLYFIQLLDQAGEVLCTQRLVVQQ